MTTKTFIVMATLAALPTLLCRSEESTPPSSDRAFVNIFADSFNGSSRMHLAESFGSIADMYPSNSYTSVAQECSTLLKKMAQEDTEWKEPLDKTALSKTQLVSYALYHIRDIACCPNGNPAQCLVLEDYQGSSRTQKIYNAALDLRQMGVDVVPFLLPLLEDRRPTRSLGWHRSFHLNSYVVLRYQDVAIQLLNDIAGMNFYTESTTGAYFSMEPGEVRRKVIRAIHEWWQTKNAEQPPGGAGLPSPQT